MATIEETKTQPLDRSFNLNKFIRKNGTQLGIFSVFILLWVIFNSAYSRATYFVADFFAS